jgi:ELWxxDGT repeat protein
MATVFAAIAHAGPFNLVANVGTTPIGLDQGEITVSGEMVYLRRAADLSALDLASLEPRVLTNTARSGIRRATPMPGNRLFAFVASDPSKPTRAYPHVFDGTLDGNVQLLSSAYFSISQTDPLDESNNPGTVFLLDGALHFAAQDTAGALSLWRTDGTPENTLKLGPWGKATLTSYLKITESRLYFMPTMSSGLYATDGTAAGTLRLTSGLTVTYGSQRLAGERLYFIAKDGAGTTALWTSDGTQAGTHTVTVSTSFTAFTWGEFDDDGSSYASVSSPVYGVEPIRVNGPAGNAVVLINIAPGTASSTPQDFTVLAPQRIVFAANDGVHGYQPWMSDGSGLGTALLKDIAAVNAYSTVNAYFWKHGAQAVFAANDGVAGTEMWVTDGTPAGTTLLKDIEPGPGQSNIRFKLQTGGRTFFTAGTTANGYELWATDGTEAGTVLLIDIKPGAAGVEPLLPYIDASRVYFTAIGPYGNELYASDGTVTGTYFLGDLNPGAAGSDPTGYVGSGGLTYFLATSTDGTQVYVSDGTTAGTRQVSNISGGVATSPALIPYAGGVIFKTNAEYPEQWYVNADPGSATLLQPGVAGDLGSTPYGLLPLNDGVFFVGNNNSTWFSDGATVELLGETSPYFWATTIGHLTYNVPAPPARFSGAGRIFYARNPVTWNSDGIYVTDGLPPGRSVFCGDLEDGVTMNTFNMANTANGIVFNGSTTADGIELYVTTTGAPGDYTRISSFAESIFSITDIFSDDTRAFAVIDSTEFAKELVATDGATAGPILDINPGNEDGFVYGGAFLPDGRFVFAGETADSGTEVWVSDGTLGGTGMIADINPGAANGLDATGTFQTLNGVVYFIADDGVHGPELWSTNGSAGGTAMIQDFSTGTSFALFELYHVHGGYLYLSASPATGTASTLHRSVGGPLAPITPAQGADAPLTALEGFTDHNGVLYFFKPANPSSVATTVRLFRLDGATAHAVADSRFDYAGGAYGKYYDLEEVLGSSLASSNGLLFASMNLDSDIGCELYTAETTPPAVTGILRTQPSPFDGHTAQFEVTFSEPVFGVGAANFVPTGDNGAAGAIITAVSGIGDHRTVHVAAGSVPGALGLAIASESGITDLMANALLPSTVTGETYDMTLTGEGEGEGEGEGGAEGEGEGEGEGEAEDAPAYNVDQNGDQVIDLVELSRVIQFYNAGSFHCQEGTEDGYAPGPGSQACAPHGSDYSVQDWSISLTELLRLVQFYNSGGYHACEGSEDGFCPG